MDNSVFTNAGLVERLERKVDHLQKLSLEITNTRHQIAAVQMYPGRYTDAYRAELDAQMQAQLNQLGKVSHDLGRMFPYGAEKRAQDLQKADETLAAVGVGMRPGEVNVGGTMTGRLGPGPNLTNKRVDSLDAPKGTRVENRTFEGSSRGGGD